jgi:hypothetical protein
MLVLKLVPLPLLMEPRPLLNSIVVNLVLKTMSIVLLLTLTKVLVLLV